MRGTSVPIILLKLRLGYRLVVPPHRGTVRGRFGSRLKRFGQFSGGFGLTKSASVVDYRGSAGNWAYIRSNHLIYLRLGSASLYPRTEGLCGDVLGAG